MKKLSQWPWKNISLGVLILLVVGLLFGNGQGIHFFGERVMNLKSYPQGGSMAESMTSSRAMIASMDMAADESAAFGIIPPMPTPGGIAPEAERRELVRTGRLSLIVADVEQSIADIKTKTQEWDGIVHEANMNQLDDERQSGWVRLRVPSSSFDEAIGALKEMALKVDSENIRVDDVTGQVVDSEARLKNLRAQEQQYVEILERAESIEDVLQATEYLNRVRNDIEWTEKSLQDVTERVSLSTITVNLIDEGDVEVLGIYWTPWLNVKKAARGALENLAASVDTVVAIVLNLPLILIWFVLLIVAGRWGWKGLKKLGVV